MINTALMVLYLIYAVFKIYNGKENELIQY